MVDKEYKFKVEAVNVLGSGQLSTASDRIRAANVPESPSQPLLVEATTSSIKIKWSEPTYDGGNAIS